MTLEQAVHVAMERRQGRDYFNLSDQQKYVSIVNQINRLLPYELIMLLNEAAQIYEEQGG